MCVVPSTGCTSGRSWACCLAGAGAPAAGCAASKLFSCLCGKKVSQGGRVGETMCGVPAGMRGRKQEPLQELSAGRALPCLCCPACNPNCPSLRALARGVPCAHCSPQHPSVHPSRDCNWDRGRLSTVLGCLAGLLFCFVCVCVCVCVVLLMTTRSFTLLHSNKHPWFCYSTSEHRKTQ